MNRTDKLIFLFSLPALLSGCDQALNTVGSEIFKYNLRDSCGEDDSACIAAVDAQFDSCQRNYAKEWKAYMNSSYSKEDELLKTYTEKMLACIVDQDGEPYFIYDSE